jgi:hypothetical protein
MAGCVSVFFLEGKIRAADSVCLRRAWKLSGIAARSAIEIKMHERTTESDLHYASREARSRLW